MVKIEINGETLRLNPGKLITLKMRNPMMYEDVLPKYYTFPFTIPLDNGTNSFLLNYPQEWKNKNKLSKKLDCLVYLFGNNNPRKSLINFNTIQETSAECNIILDKNVDDVGDKKLSDLDMGTYVLENTVYFEQYITISIFSDYAASGNFELTLNGRTFTTAQIPYVGPNYFHAVYAAFVSQINAANIGVTASITDPYGTGVYFLGIKANLPGTHNAFKFSKLQEQLDAANFETSNYYWAFFPGTYPDNTGAEFESMDQHLIAVRDAVRNAIDSYNPDTMPITFPIIENVRYIDDVDNYCGFQNALFIDGITDKNALRFLTPMPSLVYVLKKVFKALGYDAYGSFLDDPGIRRMILYSNVAADFFLEIHGNVIGGTLPNLTYTYNAKLVNIHSSIINIASHCPDMTVKEFLTEIRKFFNLRYNYNVANGSVEIYVVQNKIQNLIQNAEDFTSKMVNKWQLQNPTNTNDTVKLFSFDEDSGDDKPKQLGVLDYQLPLIIDNAAKKEIRPKVSSICEEMVSGFSIVAAVQITGVYNNQGTPTKLKFLQYFHRPFVPVGKTIPDWAKIITDTDYYLMPYAFNKDSYPMFSYVSDWSLRWDGSKGIYQKCWQTQILNDGVQVKIAMTFDNKDLLKMEQTPYQILNGSIAIWKDIDVQLGDDTIPPAECVYQIL